MSDTNDQIQTTGQAKASIIDVIQSSFVGLAKMLRIPQLKESFYQNIIYIIIVIVIMVGILVYIQIVGPTTSNDPIFSPPTKEIKKIEIKKIVEGFDANVDFDGVDTSAAPVNAEHDNVNGGDGGNELLHDGFSEHYEHNKKRK